MFLLVTLSRNVCRMRQDLRDRCWLMKCAIMLMGKCLLFIIITKASPWRLSILFGLIDWVGLSYRLTHVCSSVRSSVRSFSQKLVIGSFRNLARSFRTMGTNWRSRILWENLVRRKIHENRSNSGFLRISLEVRYRFCSFSVRKVKTTILNSRGKPSVYSFSTSGDIRALRSLRWHDLASPGEKWDEK